MRLFTRLLKFQPVLTSRKNSEKVKTRSQRITEDQEIIKIETGIERRNKILQRINKRENSKIVKRVSRREKFTIIKETSRKENSRTVQRIKTRLSERLVIKPRNKNKQIIIYFLIFLIFEYE